MEGIRYDFAPIPELVRELPGVNEVEDMKAVFKFDGEILIKYQAIEGKWYKIAELTEVKIGT